MCQSEYFKWCFRHVNNERETRRIKKTARRVPSRKDTKATINSPDGSHKFADPSELCVLVFPFTFLSYTYSLRSCPGDVQKRWSAAYAHSFC